MSFDSRYFAIADNELGIIKQRNSRILTAREAEIAEKHPEINAIERELSGTSGKLISLIADGVPDLEKRLSELENENLFLQEKLKASLVKAGYPSDYLDTVYSCKLCKDSGIYEGKRCECFMNMVKKAAAEELNRSSPLRLTGFEEFSLNYYDNTTATVLGCTAREAMEENYSFCKSYAENFHIPCASLLLHGKTGLGKTHLSLSIASVVLKKGYSVIYGSAPDLFRRIEKEQFGNKENVGATIETLQDADLLILDDIGAEFESKFYVSAFYNILNNRMNASLPTIVSTNLELPEIQERYGDRIASRLMTMENLIFVGKDVRNIKNGGKN